jgi:hypothetical protein
MGINKLNQGMKLNDILITFKQSKKKTELSKKPSLQDFKTETNGGTNTVTTNTTGAGDSSTEGSAVKATNPGVPFDYIEEIYDNLIQEEKEMDILYGYMGNQTDLSEKMRAVLVDWIIEVHFKFKLAHETLFLCIHLIDRYLYKFTQCPRIKLQLVGVCALLIACKYEEIFSPELRDFVYVTDKAYSKEDILNLESEMLDLFGFNLTIPTALRFFEILSQHLAFSEKDNHLGFYLLELFLLDYRGLKYKSSLIACSVCFIVSKVSKNKQINTIFDFLHHDKVILKECIRDILFLLDHIEEIELTTVRRKYMSSNFSQVAKMKII